MATHPLHPSSPYNYSRVAQHFINHSLLHQDDYVKRNLIELQVYLRSADIEIMAEQEDYGITTLISDLGGVIGKTGLLFFK